MSTVQEQKEKELLEAKAAYEAATRNADWQAQAYIFLSQSAGSGYVNNDANAVAMRSILSSLGLPWTAQNMHRVWGDQQFRSRFTTAIAPVTAATPVVEPEPVAQQDPNEGISIETIQSWTREEFKEIYKHKKAIVDRVLAEFSQANPNVDAAAFNRRGAR
jgi:hypothetical protein